MWNRGDTCCSTRLNNFTMRLGKAAGNYSANAPCATSVPAPTRSPYTVLVTCRGIGRYLWIVVPNSSLPLSLCEVQVFGGGGCVECEAGKYALPEPAAVGASMCSDCPANTTSVPGSTNTSTKCVCSAGFGVTTRVLNTSTNVSTTSCIACGAGKFKNASGSHPCEACPSHASSVEGRTICACVGGYTGPHEACVACMAGTYKSRHGNCSTCPSSSLSPAAAHNISDCKCKAGYAGSSDGDTALCLACTASSYKQEPGVGACVACPFNSQAPPGSPLCSCNPVFTATTPAQGCTPCAAGKYKNTAGNGVCVACAASSSSPAASTSQTDCQCGINFTGPNGGLCTVCAQGKYKATLGSGAC